MKPARKRSLRPANDPSPHALQKMGAVALPQVYWNARRLACVGVLGVFALILGIGVVSQFQSLADASVMPSMVVFAPVKKAPQKTNDQNLYDIVIDADKLVPPDEATRLAETLPTHVLITKHAARISGAMDIVVAGDAREDNSAQNKAANFAVLARNAADEGDVAQAIRFQRRAMLAAPHNMKYQLALAILLDKSGDEKGAATYYRYVAAAFDAHDTTLPQETDIAPVRRRLDYLSQQILMARE